jgi:anti-anti-sigma regulatory factor
VVTRVSLSAAVKCDPEGFSRLARLYRDLCTQSGSEVSIDFSRVSWFDSHLAAPLNVIIRLARPRYKVVQCVGVSDKIQRVLQRIGFFASLSADQSVSQTQPDQRIIPLTCFNLTDAVEFARYTKKHLDRREMPKMPSEAFRVSPRDRIVEARPGTRRLSSHLAWRESQRSTLSAADQIRTGDQP